ncbi:MULTISPECIES: iron uptake porin [Nostoc]|uniref:Iron uptake porin n=1 Tax=Nostoc paludosum FACHB-159 TaxID=2692908 RepID=A0ABR8KMA4_9NOSO|nr:MULTISPECIES: iron uptake porin [Nostoc]MBD2683532.1 iron uptake porin [Nostoc sp. FACHB-857]MBD2739859.1 iron uptake porin [Nostoc paludosum FACHB-159]
MQNYWFANFHILGCLSVLSFVILNHATPSLAKTVESLTFEKKLSFVTPTSITQLIPESIPQESNATLQGQVTSVNQLDDVQPTDWAFQVLQSLISRYNILTGYPAQTFRGDVSRQAALHLRPMTRDEFALALNITLKQIGEQIAQGTGSRISRDDLETLQRLQEEFSGELSKLQERVDGLAARTAKLEASQFSTTTTLSGIVVFGVTGGGFSGDRIVDVTSREIATKDPNLTFLYRATLDFTTSFNGTDALELWLEIGSNGADDNAAGLLEPSFGSVLDYSAKPPVEEFGVSRLNYTFSLSEDLTLSLGPVISLTDYVDLNRYANVSFLDFSTQALVNNYILFPVQGLGAGAAIRWNPNEGAFTARAAYVAASASRSKIESSSPVPGIFSLGYILYPNGRGEGGLFGDPYQGIIELEYAPSRRFALRLQYTSGSILGGNFDVFGANLELTLSDRFAVFGRYGYGSYADTAFGDLKPSYWMAGVAFQDLFIENALAGIAVGQPFIASEIGDLTQTNFEAFYNFPINDNIRVTPVFQVITNPANQSVNGTILTGTLRTVFSF